MIEPLNPWLESTLRKADRLCEDADRLSHASRLFKSTIKRAHQFAMSGAHRAPPPKLERLVTENSVTLSLEWLDRDSGWFLALSVSRVLGEKPRVELEFSGNPDSYAAVRPTDGDVRKAMHDYFQAWMNA